MNREHITKRNRVVNGVAAALQAHGFSVEVHLDMTESIVIRHEQLPGIYVAGTNLDTWAADCYVSEDALEGGVSNLGAVGFVTDVLSSSSNVNVIAAALLSELQARSEPVEAGVR
jgi:hypothetical protein